MKNIVVDTNEMAIYLYNNLIKKRFVPTNEETLAIVDIMFDYFIEIGIITEIED